MPAALLAVVCIGAVACGEASGSGARDASDRCEPSEPEAFVPRVVRTIAHDPDAFTQGLVFHEGRLFESTGLVGRSTVRELDPDDGAVLRSESLPEPFFGEGLAVGAGGRLVQLTWQDGVAFEWDPDSFEVTRQFRYDGEGWGLAAVDDATLAMSDGSDTVTLRSADDFSVIERVRVRRHGGGADLLNELEWDGEHLWANRYRSDEVLRIDLDCGTVTGVVDVSSLRTAAHEARASADPELDVSNGIAHVPGTDRYLFTGKLWPRMFEVSLVPA